MKKIFVIYVEEKDDKRAATAASIELGYNLKSWIEQHKADYVYAFQTKKEAEVTALSWNRGYIKCGKYLYSKENRKLFN